MPHPLLKPTQLPQPRQLRTPPPLTQTPHPRANLPRGLTNPQSRPPPLPSTSPGEGTALKVSGVPRVITTPVIFQLFGGLGLISIRPHALLPAPATTARGKNTCSDQWMICSRDAFYGPLPSFSLSDTFLPFLCLSKAIFSNGTGRF